MNARTVGRAEPLVHVIPRRIARRLVPRVVATRATPNQLTATWIIGWGVVAWLVSLDTWWARVAAPLVLFVSYVLDCLDGELARATARVSRLGGLLEGFGQWVGTCMILVGALVAADGGPVLAGAAITATASVNLLFLLAPPAIGEPPPVALRFLARRLHALLPVDVNLVVISAVLGHPRAGLLAWCLLATVVVAVVIASVAIAPPDASDAARSGGGAERDTLQTTSTTKRQERHHA